jgi:hypothetical protein
MIMIDLLKINDKFQAIVFIIIYLFFNIYQIFDGIKDGRKCFVNLTKIIVLYEILLIIFFVICFLNSIDLSKEKIGVLLIILGIHFSYWWLGYVFKNFKKNKK